MKKNTTKITPEQDPLAGLSNAFDTLIDAMELLQTQNNLLLEMIAVQEKRIDNIVDLLTHGHNK